MFEILTPMDKIERVSRSIAPATFVAAPGIWAKVGATGGLTNIAAGVNNAINKLVIGSSSSSPYESHDVEVGRIATMESIGTRCKTNQYIRTPVLGDFLVVSSEAAHLGKLVSVAQSAPGTYEIVARCEEVDSTAGTITFRTVSPTMVTNGTSASSSTSVSVSPSASTSPSASASASPS